MPHVVALSLGCAVAVAVTGAMLHAGEPGLSAGEPGVVQAGAASANAAGKASARKIDPAVVPAGGGRCNACGPGGCRHRHGGMHGHHPGCREGVCVPYCPVRPQQFGYYGTRWRRWPGQDILQVSDERTAAPVQPPRSEVPGANEESMTPRGIEPPDDDGAGPAEPNEPARLPQPEPPAPRPQPDLPPQPEPMPEAKPAAEPTPPPAVEPDAKPAPEAQPAPEPNPAAKPTPAEEDENLFEVLSGTSGDRWKAKRRFPASAPGGATGGDSVRPARHLAPADPRDVPRVNFDRAAETKRLRSAR